jgi:hypothetical protein
MAAIMDHPVDDHLSYPPPAPADPEQTPQPEVLLPEVLPPADPQLPSVTYSFQLPEGNSPEVIRARIKILKQITERCYMRLARDLFECYQRIFSVLVLKCNIPPKVIEQAERSRVEMILGVVTPKNAKEWLDRATTLDYKDLKRKLAQERARRTPTTPSATKPDKPKTTTPVRLACESPRGVDGVEVEEFHTRTFRLPSDADTLLTEALGAAQRVTGSHSDNFNLTCILQQFLAHRLTLEGKNDGRAGFFTRWMEEIYGGHFLHVKDERAWDILREAVEKAKNSDLLGTGKREDRDDRRDGNEGEGEGKGS